MKAPRTRGVKSTGAAPAAAAVAGADAAATTNADPADDSADLADPTSWEVSDDAPLAATSAAYAATQAAVAEPPTVHTFETPPAPGVERALVRSRLVRLSAEPDDFRSVEFGRLDRGDEVEIVDSFESYLYVRIPDGTQGWIRPSGPRLAVVAGTSAWRRTARACVGACAPRSRTLRCARFGARTPPSPAPSGATILGSQRRGGFVRALIRARAPSQSGLIGRPGSSRSISSGA